MSITILQPNEFTQIPEHSKFEFKWEVESKPDRQEADLWVVPKLGRPTFYNERGSNPGVTLLGEDELLTVLIKMPMLKIDQYALVASMYHGGDFTEDMELSLTISDEDSGKTVATCSIVPPKPSYRNLLLGVIDKHFTGLRFLPIFRALDQENMEDIINLRYNLFSLK